MMTGLNAITMHGYEFDPPKPPPPAPAFNFTPYLVLAAGIWLAWKKGWIHNGKGQGLSPKLQSGGDAGGGIA